MGVETEFWVQGLVDEAAAARAAAAVRRALGVEGVRVQGGAGVLVVVGDCDPQAVCRVLLEAGYPAVVKSA